MSEKDEARAIHERAILIDGHNDLPWRLRKQYAGDFDRFDIAQRHIDGHTDIPRLKEGGVNGQFWAAYVPVDYIGRGASRVAFEQIDLIRRMVDRYAELEMAYTAADVRRIAGSGRIASLIGVEGGHAIENSLDLLRRFYESGARYLTLTHSDSIDWADAATDQRRSGGLTRFGEEVIREMNRVGMLVDISHVSVETMEHVLRISQAPVIASHSNSYSLADHARNVPDDILRGIAEGGGLVMVNFSSGFLTPGGAKAARDMFDVWRKLKARYPDSSELERAWCVWRTENPVPRGTIGDLVDHIEHIARVAGIDHVGIGSDFDGIEVVPQGLEDVSRFPQITLELYRRGYREEQILKVLGENLLRAMAEVERVAGDLSSRGVIEGRG